MTIYHMGKPINAPAVADPGRAHRRLVEHPVDPRALARVRALRRHLVALRVELGSWDEVGLALGHLVEQAQGVSGS